jgi:hypothetical protein
MAREGGCEWYQSIGLQIVNISADFKKIFKGPWPFKKQKTYLSGLTTENLIAERPFYGFCLIPEWGVLRLMGCFS